MRYRVAALICWQNTPLQAPGGIAFTHEAKVSSLVFFLSF
jgi:hypothetical protein